MALANGVLVHGPTAWGCAVRLASGDVKVATGSKRFRAASIERPLLRGPARVAELFALLPRFGGASPRRAAVRAPGGAHRDGRQRRGDPDRPPLDQLGPGAQELLAGLLSIAPAAMALRGTSSRPTTVPSTSPSAPTSTASRARRSTSAAAAISSVRCSRRRLSAARSRKAPPHLRGPARWRLARRARHLDRDLRLDDPASRRTAVEAARQARARAPAPALNRGAVAGPARGRGGRAPACLELEQAAVGVGGDDPRGAPAAPGLRPPGREDAGGLLHRRVLQPHPRQLLDDERRPRVTMQVFQKRTPISAGWTRRWRSSGSAPRTGRGCASRRSTTATDRPLGDGTHDRGRLHVFAHLETLYLGVLARRTLITTNVERVVEAANGKPIIFMPARHDHHRIQTGDGYAAYVAGATSGPRSG